MPLLVLPPPSRSTEKDEAKPSAMSVLHRTWDPAPTLDAICRDPSTVTRPSLIDEAIQTDIKHTLPNELSIRKIQPALSLAVTDVGDLNGSITASLFVPSDDRKVRSTHNRMALGYNDETTAATFIPVIEYDSSTRQFSPETPALPAAFGTNGPWSVSVTVNFNRFGMVEHAFLDTPTKDRALNEAILHSAIKTQCHRLPDHSIDGQIRFLCLAGNAGFIDNTQATGVE
jgi:hypothetical protein